MKKLVGFTSQDYEAFAGATEGAMMGEIKVIDDDEYVIDCCVVVDDDGVGIYGEDTILMSEISLFRKGEHAFEVNRKVYESLAEKVHIGSLEEFGFENLLNDTSWLSFGKNID